MRRPIAGIFALLLAAATASFAQREERGRSPARPGTGDTTGHYVAWKYLEPGVELEKLPLVVEWVPASRAEIERSSLLDSKKLADFGGQCIGLQVVLPEDTQRIEKLGVASERPVVLLVDGEGKILRRVGNERGTIHVAAVEQMVQKELDARGEVIIAQLGEAKKKSDAGEKDAAIDVYKKVWADRCLFPFFAHEAQRELKILGVTVGEPEKKPEPQQPAPSLKKQ